MGNPPPVPYEEYAARRNQALEAICYLRKAEIEIEELKDKLRLKDSVIDLLNEEIKQNADRSTGDS